MGETGEVELGQALERAGWRQCSVFRAEPSALPPALKFDPTTEWLALCTQSCSICGIGASAEPVVEVIVATPLDIYKPDAPGAKGHLIRELHVQADGIPEHQALRFDITRRAFLPRNSLAALAPSEVMLSGAGVESFQGWMARYYARIALPGELVARMKKGGKASVHRLVQKALEANIIDTSLNCYRASKDVYRFYIDFVPRADIPGDQNYRIKVLVACTTEKAKQHFLYELSGLVSGVRGAELKNGIVMDDPDVETVDNITLGQVKGMQILTMWDHLSGLDEAAQGARSG